MERTLRQKRDSIRYQRNKVAMNTSRSFNMRSQRSRLACLVKSGPCMDCGRNLPPWMLDFDHRDPTLKSSNLAPLLAKGVMNDTLQVELEKCDLVCAVCHAYRTRQRAGLLTDEDLTFFQGWVNRVSSEAGGERI